MFIYMYNPQPENSLGIAVMIMYDIDKHRHSPQSYNRLIYAKSLDNSGWILDFDNWQFINNDNWRFQEQGGIIYAEMEAIIPLGNHPVTGELLFGNTVAPAEFYILEFTGKYREAFIWDYGLSITTVQQISLRLNLRMESL